MVGADPSTWPEDYQAAAMFSFDLDAEEMWRVKKENDSGYDRLLLQTRGEFGPNVAVPRILDLFDRHDLRCTFFIPGRVMENYPDLTRQIRDAGHEIGHHGYTHRPPNTLSRAEQREEIERGLDVFDDVLGIRPRGYRGPSNELSEYTLELLPEYDLAYDSSLINSDLPYVHEIDDDRVVELPNELSLEDWPYFGFNYDPPFQYSGGIVPTDDVIDSWRREFDGIYEYGRYFLLTLHPQLIGRAGRMKKLEELVEHVSSTGDTWIATAEEIASHWQDHHVEE